MKKKIALSILTFTIIAPVSIAFAQNDQTETTTAQETQIEQTKKDWETNREQNKQSMETLREQNKQSMETQREANKQQFEAVKQEKRLEFQNNREIMTQDRCKNIEERITTRVGRYENNGNMLETVYGNMQARLTRLIARLDTAGANTTQLKADIATLNTKIDKLKADQATLMATLKDSQIFVCGKSEGEFKGKLDEARKVPEIIKQDRQDIRNFFESAIKPDLQAIRKTLAIQKEATDKPETPSTETKATPTPIQ